MNSLLLLYSFVDSYQKYKEDEKREKFFEILKRLTPYLGETKKTSRVIKTGNSLEDLPYDLLWEILLYLEFEELKKFIYIKDYQYIFSQDSFWRSKFITDFIPKGKTLGEKGYVYPQFLKRLFDPIKSWNEKYLHFHRKIKEFKELNKWLFKLQELHKYDETFIISKLSKIFTEQGFTLIIEQLPRKYLPVDLRKYKFQLSYEDKLFLVNIIKVVDKKIIEIPISKRDKFPYYKFIIDGGFKMYIYIASNFDERLKNDKDFFWVLLKIWSTFFEYSGKRVKEDRDIVLYTVSKNGYYIDNTPFRNDKSVALKAVKSRPWSFQYLSERLKDDKELALIAVNQAGETLQFASRRLKDDKDIVLAAVKNRGESLRYASERLKDDRGIVLAAVKNRGESLRYASETLQFASRRLQDDKDIVLAAVKNRGESLRYASERFKDDRGIVLTAVKNRGESLRYASERLKDDEEIVLEAIKKARDPDYVLIYASHRLQIKIRGHVIQLF